METSTETMAASILGWYKLGEAEHGEDGAAWYGEARAFARKLAREYNVTERRAAGVIAALSPRMQWVANKNAARRFLQAAADGASCPQLGLGLSRRRAWAIANGARPLDVLGGPKTRAFYRNLTGDLTAVTVDVWAVRAALDDVSATVNPTATTYGRYEAAYRHAAELLGREPAVVQAVTWCGIRGRAA